MFPLNKPAVVLQRIGDRYLVIRLTQDVLDPSQAARKYQELGLTEAQIEAIERGQKVIVPLK